MRCRDRGLWETWGQPVREWHGEKMNGESEAQSRNDGLQNGRPDTAERLRGISHGRRMQDSALGMQRLAT